MIGLSVKRDFFMEHQHGRYCFLTMLSGSRQHYVGKQAAECTQANLRSCSICCEKELSMKSKTEFVSGENNPAMPERRKLLVAGAGIAAASLIPHASAAVTSSLGDSSKQGSQRATSPGKRKLGGLEVSAIGLGVQNMSRKYDTSTPWRPEMVSIIRQAFDEGVTFFDAAEAYGPLEVEKILGEGVAPFRDKIVIATKFGWNIDQQTGKRLPGLNSRPEHIKLVELLKTWAVRKNTAPGQIALAWLLARKPWIVPIPGTTNRDHMLQNTAAAGLTLTPAEMTELTHSLDAMTIRGQRLPDAVQVYSDVEAPLKS